LVVVAVVFVDFLNWHYPEKILQYDHDKMFMACRGGKREVGMLEYTSNIGEKITKENKKLSSKCEFTRKVPKPPKVRTE